MPTTGSDLDSVPVRLSAGASSVGVVGDHFFAQRLDRLDAAAIETRARRYRAAVRQLGRSGATGES